MRLTRPTVLRTSALLLGAASLVGCSGSAATEFGGELFIESCSLACTDGAGGLQVGCSIVDVTENQEISILFSEPVDPASVNASSVQVIDVDNGTAPDGLRFVDPLDPRRVIFRPTVSFETGVDFSFLRNRSYEFFVPGQVQGDSGPFIRSVGGSPNQSRLLCTVLTSQGVADTVPGDPIVEVFVDAVNVDANGEPVLDAAGNPILTRTQLGDDPDNPVTDLFLTSNIFFEFNELMNLPTVANNALMTAPFISVELDGDGNLSTGGTDRSPIDGAYTVTVDQQLLTTSLLFVPNGGFPAVSADDLMPPLVVVSIPSSVVDIDENPVTTLTGGGSLVAIAQRIEFDEVFIPSEEGETFDLSGLEDGSQESVRATGARWGNGILAPGLIGGSGRHGSLRIGGGQTVILNTDSQVFPIPGSMSVNVIGNQDPVTMLYPTSITETGGVFEFSSLEIAQTGRLILTGSNPARILVRGSVNLSPSSTLDVSGRSAPAHDSTIPDNDDFFAIPANEDLLPIGGPNAATGGLGGDRANFVGVTSILNLPNNSGIVNPEAQRFGRPGGGVGGDGSVIGRGNGGQQFPAELPTNTSLVAATLGGLGFSILANPTVSGMEACISPQLGGVGSGGGYSSQGGLGLALPPVTATEFPDQGTRPGQTNSNSPPALASPDANNTGYTTRILEWQNDNLRGGASGGGGGNHPYGTFSDVVVGISGCEGNFGTNFISDWFDHSAGAGGGGGGAVEIAAGREIVVSGLIDATGGDGGSSITQQGTGSSFAMPGGGGSGGAVRLRSEEVRIIGNGMVDVSGGDGGTAIWTNFMMNGVLTLGGAGSPGLVRIEDASTSMAPITFVNLANRVRPLSSNALEFLSVATGFVDASDDSVTTLRPDSISGGTSCFFRPLGPFQTLGFRADEAGVNTVESKGWTMDVVLSDGSTRPYRGSDDGSPSWEEEFGNLLGFDLAPGELASPIVVRFQGARSLGQTVMNPCDINLDADPIPQVQAGSVTPWVSHPADLELLTSASGAPFAPTMIRYVVIFDGTIDLDTGDTPGQILQNQGGGLSVVGVDNLRIEADPR